MKLMPSYLTVEEAADWIAEELGTKFSSIDVLALAERQKIAIYAPAKQEMNFDPDEYLVSAGVIPNRSRRCQRGDMLILSRKNCTDLLQKGQSNLNALVVRYSEETKFGITRFLREIATSYYSDSLVELGECRLMSGEVEAHIRKEKIYTQLLQRESTSEKSPTWELVEPKRFPGYRRVLFEYLRELNEAGKPLPTAYDVMERWRNAPPSPVYKVNHDSILYYAANGETGEASAKAIGQAINGLVRQN